MRVEKTGEGDSGGPPCTDLSVTPDVEAERLLADLRFLKAPRLCRSDARLPIRPQPRTAHRLDDRRRRTAARIHGRRDGGKSLFEYDLRARARAGRARRPDARAGGRHRAPLRILLALLLRREGDARGSSKRRRIASRSSPRSPPSRTPTCGRWPISAWASSGSRPISRCWCLRRGLPNDHRRPESISRPIDQPVPSPSRLLNRGSQHGTREHALIELARAPQKHRRGAMGNSAASLANGIVVIRELASIGLS